MFIDVVNAGWVAIYNLNLSEDVIGYMGAPAIALSYPWTRLISGHLGRLATRDDVAVHQQYIADIDASAREALESVDPVPYYMAGGQNFWAGVKGHLDAVTERAAAPVIAKYTGVLAAADIEDFTRTTDVPDHAVVPPGPRPQRTGPPLTRTRGCSGPFVLLGVGAALLVPGSLAIPEASFRPADRARAIGAWSGLGGIAVAAGPLVGGYLISAASWRWTFFINIPVTRPRARLVVIRCPHHGVARRDRAGRLPGLEAPGGVADAAPVGGFAQRQFAAVNAVSFIVYAALTGATFLLPVMLQVVSGYSPLGSALACN